MKKKNNNFSLVLGIIILFVFAFIILIDKQNERNLNLGDVASKFTVTKVVNQRMVIQDLECIYPKYYVIYFDNTDNTYIIHSFNYYQNKEQYDLEFNRLRKYIVDYNYEDYTIRYVYKKGYGNYDDLLANIYDVIEGDNLKIY